MSLSDRPREDVTDVLVNGTAGVWIDSGAGLTRADCELGDEEKVRRLAVRLAGLARRRLDEASPYVDGLLPGGVRLHALLPPLVDGGAHISLRIPRRRVSSLAQLQAAGAFPQEWTQVLAVFRQPRVLGWLALSAVLIATNWTTYVIAVNNGRTLDASLGYYLNPVLNMAAGAWLFRERIDRFGAAAGAPDWSSPA